MCHLQALPGDPHYDAAAGMQAVVDWARMDLLALQNGGVDAIMFSNEFSLPYLTKVETITVAAMARVIGELMAGYPRPLRRKRPVGSISLAGPGGRDWRQIHP